MIRRGVSLAAFACALSGLCACSLLLGEGFTTEPAPGANDSGGGDSSANDGGGDATGGSDASSSNDGAGGGDAGTDASCPSGTITLCDDFERSTVRGSWDEMNVSGGGGLELVSAPLGASGKRLKGTAGPAGSHAQLKRTTTFKPAKVHMAVTLEYAALPPGGNVDLFGAVFHNDVTAPSLVYVYVNASGLQFAQQNADGSGNYDGDTISFPTGSPHRIVVDFEFAGNVSVTVDGQARVAKKAATFLVQNPVRFGLGAETIDGTPTGFTIFADDYVFTAD